MLGESDEFKRLRRAIDKDRREPGMALPELSRLGGAGAPSSTSLVGALQKLEWPTISRPFERPNRRVLNVSKIP
jgi:hypothetical protein